MNEQARREPRNDALIPWPFCGVNFYYEFYYESVQRLERIKKNEQNEANCECPLPISSQFFFLCVCYAFKNTSTKKLKQNPLKTIRYFSFCVVLCFQQWIKAEKNQPSAKKKAPDENEVEDKALNKNGLPKEKPEKKIQIASERVLTMSKGSRASKLEQRIYKIEWRGAKHEAAIATTTITYKNFMITFVN